MKRARLVLLGLAAAALVAVASVERAVPPSPRSDLQSVPRSTPQAAPQSLDYGKAFLRQPLPGADDPFGQRSWVPPPPRAPAGPPPKPAAPPLPFAFSGVMEDSDGKTLFVRRGDSVLIGRAHELLEPNYRVEEIGTDRAVLVYLPLEERQVLPYPK